MNADADSAWVTSRLAFFSEPAWIKQWPFAHTIEITHRLHDGVLEVRTTITNMSGQPMPVAIGFHPYFRLTDSVRDEWTLSVGARTHWRLAPTKIPTGETEPIERLFATPLAVPLRDFTLDDVFGDLVRDPEGRATVSLIGKAQRLDVVFGPNYRAAVIGRRPRARSSASNRWLASPMRSTSRREFNMISRGFRRSGAGRRASGFVRKGSSRSVDTIMTRRYKRAPTSIHAHSRRDLVGAGAASVR